MRNFGSAFPWVWNVAGSVPEMDWGMTLRDWFASMATEEDIAKYLHWEAEGAEFSRTREMAKYRYADIMLEARREK